MKKHWIIEGKNDGWCDERTKKFDTYAEAEAAAKRRLSEHRSKEDWKIYELYAAVIAPVPTYEVMKAQ